MTDFYLLIISTISYFMALEISNKKLVDLEQFRHEEKSHQKGKEKFDFIVVGAGTAGCIVASKLSEKFRVLLLEAGGEPPAAVSVPGFLGQIIDAPDINYFYRSIPQAEIENRVLLRTTGKMMGGSHSHNFMAWNRGSPKIYDSYAKVTRDPSWRYKNILPLFKELESYRGIYHNNDQLGKTGLLRVETIVLSSDPVLKNLSNELGVPFVSANGPQKPNTFSYVDATIRDGRRETTYTAFIEPNANKRKSLVVIKYANVHKLIFSGIDKKKVVGVSYHKHNNNKRIQALANFEVILSTGAFGTPLILFKSGIGPKRMLREAGIPVLQHLPGVGKNLHDHPIVEIQFSLKDFRLFENIANNLTLGSYTAYLTNQTGILSRTGDTQLLTLSSFQKLKPKSMSFADIQIILHSVPINPQPKEPKYLITGIAVCGDPSSRGSFKLNTTAYKINQRDTNENLAVIDYSYLSRKEDREVLTQGVAKIIQVLDTKTFKLLGAELFKPQDCKNQELFADCMINKTATTLWHPVSTCRMGYGLKDLNSVVDPKFRVLKIKNLRIIDGSILPRISNTNTNAPIAVAALKGAKTILNSHVKFSIANSKSLFKMHQFKVESFKKQISEE